MLVGRRSERERIEWLLAETREGRSNAIVLAGEAGIGKTALLQYAVELAGSATVLSATGIEAEAELEFSGLLELCRPVLDLLEEIPEHQALALEAALGLAPSQGQDRFAVGAATLSLLAAAGEAAPVLVVVDDAQWLDAASADALRFAARRLDADRVGFLFARRDDDGGAARAQDGFETLRLAGLELDDARSLVTETAGVALPDDVAARLHEATHGNPLALLELPDVVPAAQLGGEAAIADPLPVGRTVEAIFASRAEHLPAETRRALVVVAAATGEELEPIVGALRSVGLAPQSLQPAEDDGLIAVETARVRFRHPLVRSAVYQVATPSERRAAHAALAEAFERLGDLDRRARHLAAAAIGPDETVAEALAAAGERARSRTAYAAAADAFELAARLSPDRLARGMALADAAEAAWGAGAAARTVGLVDEALALSKEPRLCSRLSLLAGRVALQAGSQADACARFERAAALIEPHDLEAAATALTFVVFSSHFRNEIGASVEAGRRARGLVPEDGSAADLRVDYALGRSLLLAGDASGGPLVERMVTHALERPDPPRTQLAAAAIALAVLDRHRECLDVVARVLELARAEGPMALTYGLSLATETELRAGRLQRAEASGVEGIALAEQLGQTNIAATLYAVLAHADAIRGRERSFRTRAATARPVLEASEMALPVLQLRYAEGLLELGLGRLEAAVEVLGDALASVETGGLVDRDAAPEPDLIEALARLGRNAEAERLLARWRARIGAESHAWSAPLAAQCDGLLADDDAFDEPFDEALRLHEDEVPFARARTLLLFGERLRRVGRKTDARARLREAYELFAALEAEPWADRARRELRATGERLRRVQPHLGDELTPQELQVALQVAEGKTNKEAGAALFLSPKTVEFHLARVYRKLDLSSRAELIRRFAAGEAVAVA